MMRGRISICNFQLNENAINFYCILTGVSMEKIDWMMIKNVSTLDQTPLSTTMKRR